MTTTSRRNLLRAGIVSTALAPLSHVWSAVAAGTTDLYSRARFKPLVGKSFTLSSTAGSWSVTLSGIYDLAGARKGADNAFGLTFRSSAGGPGHGTYRLSRSGFTTTTLFVVPSDVGRHYLQVIVNRVS
jgi:hypothetical protein